MLNIFVDTCVWRHWFTSIAKKTAHNQILQHCVSFGNIYELVRATPEQARFLYNRRIEDELGERFKNNFIDMAFPLSTKIPIPLTRHDGAYCYDGSILHGGRMGGTLRDLLTLDGYQHESELKYKAETLQKGKSLYDTSPRKKEFDVEHMESALEAEADFFLTNDEKSILARLQRASTKFETTHPIGLIYKIAMTPTVALPHVQEKLCLTKSTA